MTPPTSHGKSVKQLEIPASLLATYSAVEMHIEKGTEAYKAKDYRTAAQYFKKALKMKKVNHAIHYKLAVTYYCLKRYTSAKEHFMKTYRLQPNYAKTLQYLGLTYYQLEDFDNAKKVWLKALYVDPDDQAVIDLLRHLP